MRIRKVFSVQAAAVLVIGVTWVGACARDTHTTRVPDPTSLRTLHSGDVVGSVGDYGDHVWLGIPYAAPPVGALRWRAPQPPNVWTGTRQALAFSAICTQFPSPLGGARGRSGEPTGSEDCLYLNVYAPRFPAADLPTGEHRLPVMVWIHGGGNTIGEAGFYNGGNLAATHKLILVTMNYRLGPFGWFRHPALRGPGTNALDQSGNFGTLDLIRGLQWVQENIAAFGGDPEKVTIFGESAGGTNVYSLLLSPKASGLFQRAIVESGGLRFSDATTAERFSDDASPGDADSSNEVLVRLLMADKQDQDRPAAKARLAAMSSTAVEQYLRGKSNFEILRAYTPMPGFGMIRMPLAFRDGVVLPQGDPYEQLTLPQGYNRVPVIVGTNRDENKLFMFGSPEFVHRYFWIFPRLRDERYYNLSAEYLAKMWKASGADEPAARMRASDDARVFVYRFDWDEEPTVLGADLSVMLGAAHGFEIPFVFGHFDLGRAGNRIFTARNESARKALSAQIMSYWAAFAYDSTPGRGRDGTLPEWTAWNNGPTASKFMILDTAAGGGLRMSTDGLTPAAVMAAVDADPRLPTQRDKCMIFHDLAAASRGVTKAEYAVAGKTGCAQYPFDTYPWR